MNPLKTTLGVVLFALSTTGTVWAQEKITEANYLKRDSIIWAELEQQQGKLSVLWEAMPEKQDSIQTEYDKILQQAYKKNIALAKQYASVPSGLQRLYIVRLDMPKDTLKTILNGLTPEMQHSFYGKQITAHIKTKQIEEGDAVFQFPCTQEDGTPFDWKSTKGKQLLIIYGGLGCMGKNGREYLTQLYESVPKDAFQIIVYCPAETMEGLQGWKKQYPCDLRFVSDFKQDASPIKIVYGTQALPTCFLTDKKHIVKVKCVGVHSEKFKPYLPE